MKKAVIKFKDIVRGTIQFMFITLFAFANLYSQVHPSDTSWQKLFNGKDFEGWSTFLSTNKKEKPYLVNEDPKKVFQIIDGYLHLYKDHPTDSVVQEGFLYTNEEYSNYRLRLEYKWGDKKFAQRINKNKNSGLFFHMQEPWGFWPTCTECQIMEGSAGDIYAQNYVWFTTTIDSFIVDSQSKRSFPRFSENGNAFDYGGNQTSMRLMNLKHLDNSDGWNKVEIWVKENSAVFYINNKLSAKLWNIRYIPPDNPQHVKSLTKGRIGLQAEATEIIFRNIEIKFEN